MNHFVLSAKDYSRRNMFGIFITLFLMLLGVVVINDYSSAQVQQPININKFEVNLNAQIQCITDSFYERMEAEWKREPGRQVTEAAIFPLFGWVLEGPMFGKYNVGNYVDDNPTTNVIQDYMGNPHSYDGHRGTDIGIAHFREMDQGIGIITGAAGTVVSAPYQNFDRETSFPGSSSGNGVTIEHDDGTRAIYWHMRKNSITVNVGERVEAGQLLGLVGSSGTSTGAHLHFEALNSNGTKRDPWSGTFNTTPSLWQNQEPYVRDQELWVRDAGLSTQLAVGGNLNSIPGYWWNERFSQPAVYGIGEPFIMVWLYFFSKANDSYRIDIRKPNNFLYRTVSQNISEVVRGGYHYWYWTFSGNVTPADYGTWKYVISSEGVTLKEIPFEVGPTTIFGPRFLPLSGRSFRLNFTTQKDTLRVSSLGSAVTYSLLNAPSYVSLSNDSIIIINASANPLYRYTYFQVVATDANMRTDTMKYHVVNPNYKKMALTSTSVTCNGGSDGRISVTFGTGPGFSMSINGGDFVSASSPRTIINLSAGLHTITIQDAYGATESDTITVNQPEPLSLNFSTTDISCYGNNTGAIEVTFGGGTSGYLLKINNGSFIPATSPYTFTNLSAGTYVVTLRDAKICLLVDTVQITQPPAMALELSETDATCYGNNDGTITVTFPDSIGLTIRIDSSEYLSVASPYTFTGLIAGPHVVTLKNPFDCLRMDTIMVEQPGIHCSAGTLTYQFSDRWNLVSVPLRMPQTHVDSLFPSATHQAFRFDLNGYHAETSLVSTIGYWMKFTGEQTVTHQGIPYEYDTMQVAEGWNIIGSIYQPVAVVNIWSETEGMTTSNFFGYNQGYFIADSILPGHAYWVNVNQAGTLIVSSSVNGFESRNRLHRITITPTNEMPPPVPESNSSDLRPKSFYLAQNYPNPFNPSTVFHYQLPVDTWVTLKVYTMLGEEIATLVNEYQTAGFKFHNWEANGLASGMYYYRIQAGNFTDTKKLLLLK